VFSFLVIFLYLKENIKREPKTIVAPLKIEVYRVDRYPLPDADIYLNQRFIGRTNKSGFYFKDTNLIEGKTYTLRIEKENNGYVYGPWETHFKVEKERRKQKKKSVIEYREITSLEGESDILTQIERAQLGRVSLYEKYHFLAILNGYMYYSVKVVGKDNKEIESAKVIINGKEEGATDKDGVLVVKYSGEDIRKENIQVFKKGEHIWRNDVMIKPDAKIKIELNRMLIIDLRIYTEYYNEIYGVEKAEAYLGETFMGETNKDGFLTFKYINNEGVDGLLYITIKYPPEFVPSRIKRAFFITRDMPKLSSTNFVYTKKAPTPKIGILNFNVKNQKDYFLNRISSNLGSKIKDYLLSKGVFSIVSNRLAEELFNQFNINYREKNIRWNDIPIIKKEIDAIIYGDLSKNRNKININLYAKDYRGEIFLKMSEEIFPRDLETIAEDFVFNFKNNFPVEGTLTFSNERIKLNLGKKHGVNRDDTFYVYYDYFDELRKCFSEKRVADIKIVDAGEILSVGDAQFINEGYLFEGNIKVKRYKKEVATKGEKLITILVNSNNQPVPEANLYINDKWIGQTDGSGKFWVKRSIDEIFDFSIYKEGYIPKRLGVELEENRNLIVFNIEKGSARIFINSRPEGALVYVDEEYKGTTPITNKPLIIPYGFHLLELFKNGYKKYEEYVNVKEKQLSLTGENRINLFEDYFKMANDSYSDGNISEAISILQTISHDHPDYEKAKEFLGYIFLNDLKDYRKSIYYYSSVLSTNEISFKSKEHIFSYYNLAQAYYNEAEDYFYTDKSIAVYDFMKALSNLNIVKDYKNKLPADKREVIFQNTLFYLSVSYQKLYYLTGKNEYLAEAYYSWIDYFDFFDKSLIKEPYFEDQYLVAKSYREEVNRLKSEK